MRGAIENRVKPLYRLKGQADFVLRLVYPIDQLQDYRERGAARLHLQPSQHHRLYLTSTKEHGHKE